MHIQVKFFTKSAVAVVALVLFDTLVQFQMHLEASVLSEMAVATWVCAFIWFFVCVSPHMSEKSEHSFVISSALHSLFLEAALKDFVVLFDTGLQAEVVHDKCST